MHPTLVTINSRFVFQIGGFDDIKFDIYRLDMTKTHKGWHTIAYNRNERIVDEDVYFSTMRYQAFVAS